MNNEKFHFFSQRIWPHRISITEAGWILGFAPEDVSVLVGYKMLTPIGKPAQNSTKYFATVQIEKLRENVPWLDKATAVLNEHWEN